MACNLSVNIELCIICQNGEPNTDLISLKTGRNRIKEVAKIKKDVVYDRLSLRGYLLTF